MRKSALLLVSIAAMLAAAGVAWAQEAASAVEVSSSPIINKTPDDTWMTNGRVYSVVRSGDYVYVGGQFTRVRQSPTGKSFAATNLARFRADTGVGDPTWTPDVTGEYMTDTTVYALAAADGKIWVGGKFGAVDGAARRNLAAVSPSTGAVDPTIDPAVGTDSSTVRTMIASGQKVYIGGAFGTVDGKGRKNLAAIKFSGDPDLTWKPKADRIVWTLAFSCDRATVFAGGRFGNAAGSDGAFSPRSYIARFDATSGALHPWAVPANALVGQDETSNASDLAVTCKRITTGFLGTYNWVRSFRLDNGATGSLAWGYKTGGEVQTAAMLGPDKVIIGGHLLYVKDGVPRTRIAMVNLSDGSADPSWNPAITGKDGTKAIGPWDLLVDDNRLYVGGGFYEVGGLVRTRFARFTFTP